VAIAIDEPDARAFVARIAEHAGSAQQTEFVLVFFSKALFHAADLAAAFAAQAPGLRYGGCSTAGEITPDGMREGNALALLFPRESFRVASAMVREISTSGLERVALEVERLKLAVLARADDESATAGIFALSLIDGLSFAEEAVTSAIHWSLDDIPLLGGSAGDDMRFEGTDLIADGVIGADCAIILLVATDIPFQVFKTDNFVPTQDKLVVTGSDPGRRVVREINAEPAVEAYAAAVDLLPRDLTPLSFASYPVVVKVGGEYYSRSIRRANEDGSLSFFCAIDDGIVLTLARAAELVASTRDAFAEIEDKLDGIDMILGFDCVLRHIDARTARSPARCRTYTGTTRWSGSAPMASSTGLCISTRPSPASPSGPVPAACAEKKSE
jgi:hypothetical protein